MSEKVADVIVSVLEEAGARRCYGVPGDTLNHLTDALHRSKIRFVHTRHEETGGFAAGADAALRGELALCAGSCGPGSLHFINGLLDAHRSHAPVVLIASQVIRDELGIEFPQEVDLRSVYQSCSVFCEEVRTPESARRMTAYAAQAALTKRGVAVLIVPADVASAPAAKSPPFRVHRPRPRTLPSYDELELVADTLNKGLRVAIYAGAGCEHAHDQVVALAERLKAPVAFTSRGRDFLEYDNPYAVGMTGVFGVQSGYDAVLGCDVLLMLGCDFAWRQFYPDKATIIQLDIDPTHLGRRHPVDLGVVGDVAPTLEALLPLVNAQTDDAFLRESVAAWEKFKRGLQVEKRSNHDHGTIHSQYFTEVVDRYAEPDAIWTADGGLPIVWVMRHVRATGRNRTLASLVHGSMANAMPHALGAAAAFPGRQVISFSGDGGVTMLFGDLLTAVQENLPIKVAVLNNGSLAYVEIEQKTEGLLDNFTDLKNPDFGRVAESLGMWGKRVERAEDLDGAVREWLATPGPALLDVVTSRYELFMPSHLDAEMVTGTALYSIKGLLHGRVHDVAEMVTHGVDLLK
jgi:pyruvate dehydrogenase (quinone)